MFPDKDEKPVVAYPCQWGYKVIGPDEASMRLAVQECLDACLGPEVDAREFTLVLSRASKGGRYVSLGMTLTVLDEAERNAVFQALNARDEILMVI